MEGISELRKADEEASRLEAEARKARAIRLKAAKTEAEAEIAAYRETQDKRLAELQAEQRDSDSARELNEAAEKAIDTMTGETEKNKGKVIDVLMEVVGRVNLVVPGARKGLASV